MVHKAEALPVEAIVRGYLTGSGRKDYEKTGMVCGIAAAGGPRRGQPAAGAHLHAVHQGRASATTTRTSRSTRPSTSSAGRWRRRCGTWRWSCTQFGAEFALERGIIIADTKFEFGILDGELILIDEIMTPDSSRFWPADGYEPGKSQPSYDKQYVRDYLETLDWDKTGPARSCRRRWPRRPPRSTWRPGAA